MLEGFVDIFLFLSTELKVPEVNQEIKAELEGMGFGEARSVRALHFSGIFIIESPFSLCTLA